MSGMFLDTPTLQLPNVGSTTSTREPVEATSHGVCRTHTRNHSGWHLEDFSCELLKGFFVPLVPMHADRDIAKVAEFPREGYILRSTCPCWKITQAMRRLNVFFHCSYYTKLYLGVGLDHTLVGHSLLRPSSTPRPSLTRTGEGLVPPCHRARSFGGWYSQHRMGTR
ncbi:hypothetical protein BDN67DRAFT_103218 [Paxillus ammoniavirescens]|nr:hypothetical protein BDN67DRAFT_103218 [Paxillus ammoniavirescens]